MIESYISRHPERLHSNQAVVNQFDRGRTALTVESVPFFARASAKAGQSSEDEILLGCKSIPSNEEFKLQIESSSNSKDSFDRSIVIQAATTSKRPAHHEKKDSTTQSSKNREHKSQSEKGTQVDIKTLVKDIGLNSDSAKQAQEAGDQQATTDPENAKKIKSKQSDHMEILEYDSPCVLNK